MSEKQDTRVRDVRVAAHSIVLPRGKFCISVAEVATGVAAPLQPGISVTAVPGEDGTVTFARMGSDPWLRETGDAVMLTIAGTQARILLTSYNMAESDAVKPPRMQIQRLDLPLRTLTEEVPAMAQAPAKKPAVGSDFLVHVAVLGDQQGAFGDWVGSQGDGHWIEGVQITAPPGLSPDELEYQVVLGKGWTSPWSSAGVFCGSRGMTLPVQGLRVSLRGAAAALFEVSCEGRTVSGRDLGPVGSGVLCGTEDPEPMAMLRIAILPVTASTEGGLASATEDGLSSATEAGRAGPRRKARR